MTLQDSLDKLKEKIEGRMPSQNVAIMHQATADLKASGIGAQVLKAGEKAPDFKLVNHKGEEVDSKELIEKGPLVITFYRGVWCPYCNTDLAYLKRIKSEIDQAGATLLCVSPQQPEFNQQIVETQKLNFDLLTDPNNEIAAQFGLRWVMVDPLRSLYKNQFRIELPTYNGDDSWSLPVPARFIIDKDGIIGYAEYSVDYTKRPNPDVLLEALNH